MDRRTFLTVSAASALAGLHSTRNANAQDPAQDEIPFGETRLALSDDPDSEREGTVYVPKQYKHGVPIPLLMMLHGFRGTAQGVRYTFPLAEEFGVVVIAPESREVTWGQSSPGFDGDMRYIGAAYRAVTGFLDVDRAHVAVGGVSDGATYALSMGLAYGDVFNHLMVFSEGIAIPYRKQGKPRIFIGHGIKDVQMPIERTSRRFVPQLKAEGYDVTYREYDGGHGVPSAIVREAFQWFVAKPGV
jgi:phospholipase/carboxylesterase